MFTSNVDGQFQQAGFDARRVTECHGSIHDLQCSRPCSTAIWSADQTTVDVDGSTFRARPPVPACPRCGAVARPNILMFGDGQWIARRTERQEEGFAGWLRELQDAILTVVECGAGTAVPTVRTAGESLARKFHTTLIRINSREAEGPPGTLSFAAGALATLTAIDAAIQGL